MYPDECWSQVEEKTAFIKPAFTKAKFVQNAKKDNPPLLFHDKFSRFEFYVIVEKKVAKASIPVVKKGNEDSIHALFRKSDFAYRAEMQHSLMHAEKDTGMTQTSPAYTVKIFSLGGRTPAEILNTDGGEEMLRKQREFLAGKTSDPKYGQMNQRQVAAIDAALNLKGQGGLKTVKNDAKQIILYKSSIHVNPYQTRADGKHPCNQIEIIWTIGDKRQVNLHIRNFFADMKTDEKGLNQFVASTICDDVNNSVRVEAESWMDAVESMRSNLRVWERLVGPSCMEEAYRAKQKVAADAKRN
ncbi:MAG: hypothetical protein Q4B26_00235 [Eubacteriales bacterium]|nr:hypothetical protein [Eubacteriales bacterium]